ncbi:MAG: DEAD/DEAH box helicase [Candidatus Hydrogenedentes bacterium]|nr:DEAD/DEAH box helicase [Candidatus Hydrogenedentota bacterium]
MKMQALLRYDIPPEILVLWQRCESPTLLPLQERAVKEHGLFDGGNLLIQAPTSSGKTFIGEMAAIQTALRRKKVVYLVPLKALAEEKFRDFNEKYTEYGLKVIISTRDHRQFDQDFESGAFSMAIVVYEKLAQLLVRRPERLEDIDLVIADELEILSDPERGAMAEILFTRLLRAQTRIIGLSAVIGGADELAEWLQAEWVRYDRRPVELRFGVLHEGRFRYRTYNESGEGEESLVDADSDSPWEHLVENVCAFADRGEPCMIFVKSKHEARRGAELLAARLELLPASESIEALQALEPTHCREALLQTMAHGVAFHSADLRPEERALVEQAYRRGEVGVMVSTSTLAVGLNLPAQNVFLNTDKWRYDTRLGIPWKTAIQHTEYENMGGRAGRYGAGHPFGRSILVATTPFDQETLWRRYVEGERERIQPQLDKEPLENHILGLVASRTCCTVNELQHFLECTLTGKWQWQRLYTLDEVAFRIRAAINRCIDAGMIGQHPATAELRTTPLGQTVAAKGISVLTAKELEHWIGESELRNWHPLELIYAAASAPDAQLFQVMLTAKEYDHADYTGQLKLRLRDEPGQADIAVNRLRNTSMTPFFEEVRSIKVALFLHDWIEHHPLFELEERYHTTAGQVHSAAEQVAWLIDAAAALAEALGGAEDFVQRIQSLSACVQRGVGEELLPLAKLNLEGVNRSSFLDLYGQGLHTAQALAACSESTLESVLPPVAAEQVRLWARAHTDATVIAALAAPNHNPAPVLVVDDRHPGKITLDGREVSLQEKQYRLIRVLAAAPGQCVPYDDIYEAVWGSTIVESGQMHFQKRKLLGQITGCRPERADLITTTPKRGFVLNLYPSEVRLTIREPESMARSA